MDSPGVIELHFYIKDHLSKLESVALWFPGSIHELLVLPLFIRSAFHFLPINCSFDGAKTHVGFKCCFFDLMFDL